MQRARPPQVPRRRVDPPRPRAEGGAIYGGEEKARQIGLTGYALRIHRQTTMRPLVENFDRWRSAVKPTLLPSEPLAAAVRYYDNHRDALFRFIDAPDVPIDNSPPSCVFRRRRSPVSVEADHLVR